MQKLHNMHPKSKTIRRGEPFCALFTVKIYRKRGWSCFTSIGNHNHHHGILTNNLHIHYFLAKLSSNQFECKSCENDIIITYMIIKFGDLQILSFLGKLPFQQSVCKGCVNRQGNSHRRPRQDHYHLYSFILTWHFHGSHFKL